MFLPRALRHTMRLMVRGHCEGHLGQNQTQGALGFEYNPGEGRGLKHTHVRVTLPTSKREKHNFAQHARMWNQLITHRSICSDSKSIANFSSRWRVKNKGCTTARGDLPARSACRIHYMLPRWEKGGILGTEMENQTARGSELRFWVGVPGPFGPDEALSPASPAQLPLGWVPSEQPRLGF